MININYKKGTKFYVKEDGYNLGLASLKNDDILVLHHMSECVVDPQGKVMKRWSKVKNMEDTEVLCLTKDVTYTIDENDFVAYVDKDEIEYVKDISTKFIELVHTSNVFISKGKVIKNIYIVYDTETIDSLAGVLDLVKVEINNSKETKEVLYNDIINLIKVTKGGKVSYHFEINENYDEKQVVDTIEHLYTSGVTRFETDNLVVTDIHDFITNELSLDSTIKQEDLINLFKSFNLLLKDNLVEIDCDTTDNLVDTFKKLDIDSKLNVIFEMLNKVIVK